MSSAAVVPSALRVKYWDKLVRANNVDPDQTSHKSSLFWVCTFAIQPNLSRKSCLTHCILVDSYTVICWMSPFVILGVSGLFLLLLLNF